MRKFLIIVVILFNLNDSYTQTIQNDTTVINDAKAVIENFEQKKAKFIIDSLKLISDKIEIVKKINASEGSLKLLSKQEKKNKIKIAEQQNLITKQRNEFTKLSRSIDDLVDNKSKEIAKLNKAIEQLKVQAINLENKNKKYIDDVKKLKDDSTKLFKANKEDSTKNQILKDSAKTQITILDSVRSLLEKVKDTLVVISEIALTHIKTPMYSDSVFCGNQNFRNRDFTPKKKLKSTDTLTISNVKIRIKEGAILYINVYTNRGVFRNKRSPIGLTLINEKRMYDKLYKDGYESRDYLLLSDVITYTPRRNYNYIPYADIEFSLNKKDSVYFIKENTNINFYVDVAAFTDIKGISGDANGLAQILMSGRFITNTKNIRQTSIIPFNFISAEGFIAKFDNNFKGVFIDTLTAKVDRTKLFQTSYYRVGAKLNLLHWVISPYPRRLIEDIQLNFGYNFNGARTLRLINKATAGVPVYDTIFTSIIQNQWYIEPTIRFTRNSNFGFSLSLPIIWQSVKASAGISNKETIVYANPTISLSYFSPKSPSNRIFFRYSNFIDLKNPENAFTQAQLGYSASLTDVFKINK